MNSILRVYVPSTLNAAAQHTEVLIVTYRSHSWYIKAIYTSWSSPLFSQDLELMKIEVIKFIIYLTVV